MFGFGVCTAATVDSLSLDKVLCAQSQPKHGPMDMVAGLQYLGLGAYCSDPVPFAVCRLVSLQIVAPTTRLVNV